MNVTQRYGFKALMVAFLMLASITAVETAQAGPDRVIVYGNGHHAGYVVTWRNGRRAMSPYLRDYGWYAPGHYYNHSSYRDDEAAYEYGPVPGTNARLWCPELGMYVVDEEYCPIADEDYVETMDDEDTRAYDGYRRHRRLYQSR